MKHTRRIIAIIMAVVFIIQLAPMLSMAATVTPGNVTEDPSGSISMNVGNAQQVAVGMLLSNQVKINVSGSCTWASSDPSVATVTYGVIYAVYQGTTTVTASPDYPGYSGPSAIFNVTVNGSGTTGSVGTMNNTGGSQSIPDSLELYPASGITLNAGGARQVDAALQYSNGQLQNVSQYCYWNSSDTTVATVTNGVIYAVYQGPGTESTTVTAVVYANNGSQWFSSNPLTVNVNISNGNSATPSGNVPPGVTAVGLIADPSRSISLAVGSAQQLTVGMTMSGGYNVNLSQLCTWTATGSVSVSGCGIVLGNSVGTGTVTATVNNYDGYGGSVVFSVYVTGG